MLRFVLTRLGLVIPTFIGITLLSFALPRMIPGDPVEVFAGERGVSPERHAQLMAQLGFDRPLIVQYWDYITDVLSGDLGRSFISKRPVLDEFLQLFPATVELSVCALLFAVLIGLPAGIIAAVRRGRATDHALMGISLVGYSMPIFWWAMLLILLFSVTLGWTPVSGRISAMYWVEAKTGFLLIDTLLSNEKGAFVSAARHLILPAVALGTIPLAIIARITRSSMLEVLNDDYIRTARAKGLSPIRVVSVHALRNALIPVITVIGLQVGLLLTGAILTETTFAWPGIGKWIVDSLSRRDYAVLQSGILLIATMVIMINLLVDVLYGVVNPRIRHRR